MLLQFLHEKSGRDSLKLDRKRFPPTLSSPSLSWHNALILVSEAAAAAVGTGRRGTHCLAKDYQMTNVAKPEWWWKVRQPKSKMPQIGYAMLAFSLPPSGNPNIILIDRVSHQWMEKRKWWEWHDSFGHRLEGDRGKKRQFWMEFKSPVQSELFETASSSRPENLFKIWANTWLESNGGA
jgi:hypothetical protein